MKPLICAVCDHVLDMRADDDGFHYQHTLQDLPADHDPVPIEQPAGWTGGRCDFCNDARPEWVLPSRTFETPIETATSGGDWAACNECARFIERDQWNALIRRCVDAFMRRHPEHGPETATSVETRLKQLYRKLRKNISGSLRPL